MDPTSLATPIEPPPPFSARAERRDFGAILALFSEVKSI